MKMNHTHECCVEKEGPKLYRIGMFAAMNHVTIKALRYYDEQDLLKPEYVDGENGYRYYQASQIAELHQILALKNIGFSLEDIRKIRNGISEKNLLVEKKKEILQEISRLMDILAQVEGYLSEDETVLFSPVLIKSLPKVSVAAMERRIESYDELFEMMPEMGEEMEKLGCICAEPEYCFVNYPEPGYKDEHILVESCQSVSEKFEDSELVKYRFFPEVKEAACIFHKGSYDTFPKSYALLLNFIEKNGYEICGNIRESYIDGVWNKETEKEWLSEIQIPVKKKERK